LLLDQLKLEKDLDNRDFVRTQMLQIRLELKLADLREP